MAFRGLPGESAGGWNFQNGLRNAYLISKGFAVPKMKKTGTTIVGMVYKDGVILGADTRATEDNIIADKNCDKIHYLAPNMYCCGAGIAADTLKVTQLIASKLELHRLDTDRIVPVSTANHMLKKFLYRFQGNIGAALILGGVDFKGPSIYSIRPRGSSTKSSYATMGSGALAAMAIFEDGWRPDMTLQEGQRLVRDAVAAGIFNDLGSGSNVDMCVITNQGARRFRPYELANVKGKMIGSYPYRHGTTAVLATKVIPFDVVEEDVFMSDEVHSELADQYSVPIKRRAESSDEEFSD